MSDGPLLDVRDLYVERAGRRILSGVSFAIPPGAIVGLCGDSGSGKTTLGLALLRLLPPVYRVQGRILLDGRDLAGLTEREMERVRGARIGYIFQDPLLALNPVVAVRTQIVEILHAHGKQRDPAELLELTEIGNPRRILEMYPHQLSGGERQRVTIAQALACNPAVVVADEPFTALDAPRVVALAGLFRRLRDELRTSFLLISHTPGVLALTADEVMRIGGGRIAARGPGGLARK